MGCSLTELLIERPTSKNERRAFELLRRQHGIWKSELIDLRALRPVLQAGRCYDASSERLIFRSGCAYSHPPATDAAAFEPNPNASACPPAASRGAFFHGWAGRSGPCRCVGSVAAADEGAGPSEERRRSRKWSAAGDDPVAAAQRIDARIDAWPIARLAAPAVGHEPA